MQADTPLNNRYRIIYAIDERPNGVVYHGRDEQNGTLVLIGALPITAETRNDTRLLVQQLATIKHDALLPVRDHFAEGDFYYVVCDDPGGQGLERALRARGGPLAEADVLQQAQRLLHLLEHLHNQKPPLYAGDLWPTDLIVTDQGWRLAPFPLARMVSATPSPYHAPELAEPYVEPSSATDTYALSALLYQALTNVAPPTADQQKEAGAQLVGPRSLNPQLSALTEQALLRGLQQRAPNRYQNARELRLALETVHLMAGRSLGLGPDVMTQSPALPDQVPGQSQPVNPQAVITQPLVTPSLTTPLLGPTDQPQAMPHYVQEAPATPKKRGLSTGCLIGVALGLAFLAIGLAIAVVMALTFSGTFARSSLRMQNAVGSGASQVATLGPGAIQLSNASTITYTSEITGEVFGPLAYSPNSESLAIGISNVVSIRSTEDTTEQLRLTGHTGDVFALAWSPDGSLLASSASNDTLIRLWNPSSGEQVRVLEGHESWIRSVTFSPDGKLLASASVDLTIRLWNVADGTLLTTLNGHSDWPGSVAFAPDGRTLASTGRDGTVRLWNVATGRQVPAFEFQNADNPVTETPFTTTGLAFSSDGDSLAVGSYDGSVFLLDARTGEQQRKLVGHESVIVLRAIVFTPDDKNVISASFDGTIRTWDVATGNEIGQFEGHQLRVSGLSITPDGRRLASISGEEGQVMVWDVATRQKITELPIGQGIITGLSYSLDGRALGLTGYTGAVRIHAFDEGRDQILIGSSGLPQSTAFLQNNRIVTLTDQDTVMIGGSGGQSRELRGLEGKPAAVVVNRTGSLIVVGSQTGGMSVWDAEGQKLQAFQSGLPQASTIAISDDGRYIAIGGSAQMSQIEVWDGYSGTLLHTLVGPRDGVTALTFQPGGTLLAAADFNGEMLVWDASDGRILHLINANEDQERFTALTFSPDGSMIVGGALNGDAVFWNATDGVEVARVSVSLQPILALAFSPSGQQLAASVRNESASVYTLEVPK